MSVGIQSSLPSQCSTLSTTWVCRMVREGSEGRERWGEGEVLNRHPTVGIWNSKHRTRTFDLFPRRTKEGGRDRMRNGTMERGRRRIRFDLERLGYAFGFLSLGLAIHEAWKKARKKVENEEIPLEVQAEEDGSLTASFFRGRFPEPVEELRKINEEIVEGYNRLWIQWQEALEANEALELDCKMWQRRLKDTQDEMFALRREIEELRKKLEGSNVRLSVDFETRLRARRLSHAEADKETPMTEERGDGLDALRKEAKLLRHAIQEIERGSLLHVSELETPKSRNSLLARTRSPFQRLNRRFDKENIQ